MNGAAGDPQAEGERSAIGGHEVEIGGLGDHAGVGAYAVAHEGEGAQTAVLLTHDGCDVQVSGKTYAGRPHRARRDDRGHEPALHVAGAATDEDLDAVPVHAAQRIGIAGPLRAITRRHDVGVPVDEQ